MSKVFYPKLAASNIRKNSRTYIPYLLTCIFTVGMFYIIFSLSRNEGLSEMIGAETITYTLGLGCWVVAIFAAIFLFYTNSFLVKRRKKEFGLYNILGMEKKHLAKVIAFETLYIAVLSLLLGLGLGMAFDKLMYLLILKLVGAEISLGFYISTDAVLASIVLFGAIFVLIFLNSLRQVHLAKPIELLRGGNVGEKEPKTKWLMAIFGLLCLAGGYYIAVKTENPVAAVAFFFLAVILVILGTYLLFTAGSIALLKLLRRKKSYYYKARHFTSVSGMIYRMKQNAVGLANICILSTMVLVMVSSTSAMMLGMEEVIHTRYPYDITVYSNEKGSSNDAVIKAKLHEAADRQGLRVTKEIAYTYLSFSAAQAGSRYDLYPSLDAINSVQNLFFVPLADYNRITGEGVNLADGEIMIYSNRDYYEPDTLQIFDRSYRIVRRLDNFLGNGVMAANIASSQFIVVKDMDEVNALYQLQKEVYQDNASDIRYCAGMDLSGSKEEKLAAYEEVKRLLPREEYSVSIESRDESRTGFLSIYGGLFFLGIFLGSLFIVATILIIYYKQISEGYDDKERFEIMQKVGMSQAEVKRTIRSQILTVFFLPLIMAGVHVAFAFHIISQILAALSLTNTLLLVLCTVGCFLLFALLYGVIYTLTARAYYRIVSR